MCAISTTTPKLGLPRPTATDNVTLTNQQALIDAIDNGAAPTASPAFTGTPTAPTATAGTNTDQLATTKFVQTAIGAIPVVTAATTSARGAVKVTTPPASGDPIAPSRVGSASDTQITTTGSTTIATFTPTVNKSNYMAMVYYRVVTGTTNVTVQVTYADGTGAQTTTLINAQSSAVGSYSLIPLFLNATTAAAINVIVQASVANQVYASASIVGV
ncbi:hypothetical protein [Paenibacillus sp. SI8]|uniref:hypothetical protein n=1 Tax=unclassified Paenibacillus TaxID=185978 RepID=UPI003467DA37